MCYWYHIESFLYNICLLFWNVMFLYHFHVIFLSSISRKFIWLFGFVSILIFSPFLLQNKRGSICCAGNSPVPTLKGQMYLNLLKISNELIWSIKKILNFCIKKKWNGDKGVKEKKKIGKNELELSWIKITKGVWRKKIMNIKIKVSNSNNYTVGEQAQWEKKNKLHGKSAIIVFTRRNACWICTMQNAHHTNLAHSKYNRS